MTDTAPVCQSCGVSQVAATDFLCRFCFIRLPNKLKRSLRLAKGRSDEVHTKGKALLWLRQHRTGTRAQSESSTPKR